MGKGRLIFKASNLGPITEAKIELKPLTVFVGHSNTGKSYMSTMIYSILKYLKSCISKLEYSKYTPNMGIRLDVSSKDKETYERMLEILGEKDFDAKQKEFSSFLIEETHSAMADQQALKSELLKNYCLESERGLIQLDSQKMNFDFEIRNSDNRKLFCSSIELNEDLEIRASVSGGVTDASHSLDLGSNPDFNKIFDTSPIFNSSIEDESSLAFYMGKFINDLCLLHIKDRTPELENHIHYLPAARSGIMQISPLINQSMIENMVNFGPRDFNNKLMTGVIADFLSTIDRIRQRGGNYRMTKEGDNLGSQIEERILQGRVIVSGEGGPLSRISYMPDGWNSDLSMSKVSSMVSEIAPIVLYFRYILQRGDILILEEPEAHVHPEAQLLLVKEISEAVSKGVSVILTTHSEWITEEIKSLVDISQHPENEWHLEGRKIAALDKSNVGIWHFEQTTGEKNNVHVKEIKCNDGGDLGFDTAYSALINDESHINNRIQNKLNSKKA